MVTAILSGQRYNPEDPPSPDDPQFQVKLVAYLRREYQRIAESLRTSTVLTFEEQFVSINKPQIGDTVLADGVSWDPGSGEGMYTYYAGAWHKLG